MLKVQPIWTCGCFHGCLECITVGHASFQQLLIFRETFLIDTICIRMIFFLSLLFCCCSCFVVVLVLLLLFFVVVFLINFAYCLDVFCLVFFFSILQTASQTRSIKVNHSCVKGAD